MANIDNMGPVVTKELHLYYLLDTSSSMEGKPIAALNDAMRSTITELIKTEKSYDHATFRVGVLQFNDSVEWVTVNAENEPVVSFLEDIQWHDLRAGGRTQLGAALKELNKRLSRNSLQESETGNYAPVVIIMSDGRPTDNWKLELEKLNQNGWYQVATKIAFALGDRADEQTLSEVVGTPEAVIKTSNLEAFKRAIQLVSIRSSIITTTPAKAGEKRKDGKEIAKQVAEEIGGGFGGNGENQVTTIPEKGLLGDPVDVVAKKAEGGDIKWATGPDPTFGAINFNDPGNKFG